MKTERELFLYELDGRGFSFNDKSHTEFGFNDEVLNMVYEMWCASASREGYTMKYSNFKVGDHIVRRYNNRVYRIANTADSSGQEFLIIHHPLPSKHRFSCEIYTNMRIATGQEIQQGYAEEF